jgi:phosphatidylglycerol:prolipoprotein diacylglycerol transferase
MLAHVHPVLFHIGALLVPTYGACAALGVLAALLLAQRTARIARVNPAQIWSLSILSIFAAILVQRLLLVLFNWRDLGRHPRWLFAISAIHHPLLATVGSLAALIVAFVYARRKQMPLAATADALAAPLALGLAFEQLGALAAGSGYGRESSARFAATYTDILAARLSGTPLGIPLHPVQAYAALAFLTLALLLLVVLPTRRRAGDVAGIFLLGAGVSIYLTELWRDPEGRGTFLSGALDGPQLAAILFVLTGAVILLERKAHKQATQSIEVAHG